jgi:hypothetical protein
MNQWFEILISYKHLLLTVFEDILNAMLGKPVDALIGKTCSSAGLEEVMIFELVLCIMNDWIIPVSKITKRMYSRSIGT